MPIYLPGLFLNSILSLILNFSEYKSILGVSKWPKVGKQVGDINPFLVLQPTLDSSLKFSWFTPLIDLIDHSPDGVKSYQIKPLAILNPLQPTELQETLLVIIFDIHALGNISLKLLFFI